LGGDVTIWILKPIWAVIYYVSFAVIVVLKLIWKPLEFILLPFIYLGSFLLNCLAAPFRFLAKFEVPIHPQRRARELADGEQTLYVYVGIAAIIGIAGGLLLSLVSGGLQGLLGLGGEAQLKTRSAKDYRKEKRSTTSDTKRRQVATASVSPPSSETRTRRKKGKRSKTGRTPTILEELDSDE